MTTHRHCSALRPLLARLLVIAGVTFVWSIPAGAADSPRLSPPVITENFTPLPCHHTTTIGLEGCAEGQLLSTDRRLNEQVKLLFTLMPTDDRKVSFDSVERAWLAYRKADCSTVTAAFQGGTIAPVDYALCEVRDNVARSADLHSLFELMEEGNSGPRWP